MLATNTMQRGSDNFSFRRQALLKTTDPIVTKGETSITGFTISGTEPEGTNRRVIFEVDNKLWYFTKDGLTEYPYYGELADVLEYGNTVAELLEVDGIVRWLNKEIYPIIALDAPRTAEVMPRIKIGLNVGCFNDEYTRDELSPVYELKHADNAPARITNATYNKSNNGYAKSSCLIRLKDMVGEFGDWIEFSDAITKEAVAVQFKATYILTTLDGSDEAQIFDCMVEYVTDSGNSAGDTLEIFTTSQTGTDDLGHCRALIKHTELLDAEIKAYVNVYEPCKRRDNIIIGRGNGSMTEYYLGVNGGIDPNIDVSSLHITAGGVNVVNFYYNSNNATVTVQVSAGVEIRASYNYDIPQENWVEMAGELCKPYEEGGLYFSRFIYRLTDTKDKKSYAVKFSLHRKSGSVVGLNMGVATGKQQTFVLPHRAKKETIKLNGTWTYDEDTQILKVTSIVGDFLGLSYDWVGVIPSVDSFMVGAEYAV